MFFRISLRSIQPTISTNEPNLPEGLLPKTCWMKAKVNFIVYTWFLLQRREIFFRLVLYSIFFLLFHKIVCRLCRNFTEYFFDLALFDSYSDLLSLALPSPSFDNLVLFGLFVPFVCVFSFPVKCTHTATKDRVEKI